MNLKVFVCCLCIVLTTQFAKGQTLPVGLLQNTDDALRRQQLLGTDTSGASFMIRPIYLSGRNNLNLTEENSKDGLLDWNRSVYKSNKVNLAILPLVWQQQYNSHHPYGMNDGAMIPSRGYETMVSGGVYFEAGPLSIQLRPEFVFAENKDFIEYSEIDNGTDYRAAYLRSYNRIDLPERFGTGPYSKLNWGQSSIRLNYKAMSIGFSTENLWWGPGVRNSLLMSNNAPGFKHFTLNSTRPLNTFLGSFEGQIIAGRLDGSGIPNPPGTGFVVKPNDWRYISGIVLTYHPKWVPGLYFGLDRTYIIYRHDMGRGFFDYFPIFTALEKKSLGVDETTNVYQENLKRRDQRISFFTRWILTEARAEVYFQFARDDHSYDLRDAILEPEHSSAYIAGFRKLVPLAADNEFVQVGLEVASLEAPGNKNIRPAEPFYSNGQVIHGYTNNGQVIGAGIGPGSNLQTLDVSWVRGLKKIGIQFERKINNNDLFYRAEVHTQDFRRHWVDLSVTGNLDWDFKKFMISTQVGYIRSLNYQYRLEQDQGDFFWNWNKQDVGNLHIQIGTFYRF